MPQVLLAIGCGPKYRRLCTGPWRQFLFHFLYSNSFSNFQSYNLRSLLFIKIFFVSLYLVFLYVLYLQLFSLDYLVKFIQIFWLFLFSFSYAHLCIFYQPRKICSKLYYDFLRQFLSSIACWTKFCWFISRHNNRFST